MLIPRRVRSRNEDPTPTAPPRTMPRVGRLLRLMWMLESLFTTALKDGRVERALVLHRRMDAVWEEVSAC